VLPKEDDEAANIFALTLLLTIGMTVLTASSIWLFGSSLARLVGIEEYATWLWCIPVLLFVFGIYQSSNYWCTRNQEFTRLAASRIGQSAGIVSTQIGTGILLGSSPAGLIMGRVVGQPDKVFLWEIDLHIGSIINEAELPDELIMSCSGITFLDGYVWAVVGSAEKEILKISPHDGRIVKRYDFSGDDINGITNNGDQIFIADGVEHQLLVLETGE